MNPDPPSDITDLLVRLREGDAAAMERLMPLVYNELRRRAHHQLSRGGPDAALDTTGLVHEAWMRLARTENASFADRNHFYGVAVKADGSGEVRWTMEFPDRLGTASLADATGDGTLQILVACADGYIYGVGG